MKNEQIKQEELKAFALEDEALEGVSGGLMKKFPGNIADPTGLFVTTDDASESSIE